MGAREVNYPRQEETGSGGSYAIMTETFTAGTSLSTMLATESLLFASFSLAVSMMTNTRNVRRQVVPDGALIILALVGLFGVAVAAGAGWS